MGLVRGLKDVVWSGVARGLSAAAGAIRRKPSRLTPDEWRAVQFSYSHYGEDLVVLHLLRDKVREPRKGVYVDVGAFDPALFSNTLLLNQHGWRGINIEANPLRIERFRRMRPGDINLCAVVSDRPREVLYLHYAIEGHNRLAEPDEPNRASATGAPPVRTDAVKAVTLAELLRPHLPDGAAIDFLNVDCEGEDLNVLRSLDWSRWQPLVAAVEAYGDAEREAVRGFMRERGYTLVAQTILTLIFYRTGTPLSDLRRFA
jgi:FkbM family methyltransferase